MPRARSRSVGFNAVLLLAVIVITVLLTLLAKSASDEFSRAAAESDDDEPTIIEHGEIRLDLAAPELDEAPSEPSALSEPTAEPAPAPGRVDKQAVQKAIRSWGYDVKAKALVKSIVRGKRVLDVGMGQGPWGPAVLMNGAVSYVGLDPAVCPPVHANTRNPSFKRKGSQLQCMKAHNTTNYSDPAVESCTGGSKKYRVFPVTGVEMMGAFPDSLALLPGTFETVGKVLREQSFDVVLFNCVTEHFDRLHEVFRGLWEVLGGCSASAQIRVYHHNYYGFSGHHGYGGNARDAKAAPPHLRELIDWAHLDETVSQASQKSINRVRPGDLSFLLDTYFRCSCTTEKVPKEERARLSPTYKVKLLLRGFTEQELFSDKVVYLCTRRGQVDAAREASLSSVVFHHPRMDGSYKPHEFMCESHGWMAGPDRAERSRGAVCRTGVAELKAALGHAGEGACAFDF